MPLSRSYIAQAIFRVVGYYVAFTPPWARRDTKENEERRQLPDEDLYHLVNVLNDWADRMRSSAALVPGEKCDFGQLLVSVYSRLVEAGLLDPREVDNLVGSWIDGLENIGQRIISLHC